MADKTKILDIDIQSIITKSTTLKKELDDLRAKQDALKKSNDTSSEAWVKLDAQIKKTSGEYNLNQKALQNLNAAGDKFLSVNEKINLSLEAEIKSIADARANNSELLKIRNQLNLKDEEQLKLAGQLNAKMDENNKFIKENVSADEKRIYGIGQYKEAISGAFQEMGLFNGGLGEMQQAGGAVLNIFGMLNKDLGTSASQMANAARNTEGMTASQKAYAIAQNASTGAVRIFAVALAATGIGLIIAAVALLIGYLRTFTPIMDQVEQATAGFGAVIKTVQQSLVSFVKGLTDVEGTIKKIGSFIKNPIQGFKDMAGAMREAYDAAADLKKQEQDLEDAMSEQELQSAKNRAEINRLTIQAKDRTKSEAERIALLRQASALENKDFEQRKATGNAALKLAQDQIIQQANLTKAEADELRKRGLGYKEFVEGRTNDTDALFDKLKEAMMSETDIQNEYYSNQEKNINKQNKLIEEAEIARTAAAQKAQEVRQKSLDDAVNKSKAELDLFISQQGSRAKSAQEELDIAEKVRDKKLEIAQKEYDASEKLETDKLNLIIKQNEAKDAYLATQANVAIANAERELAEYRRVNQSKLDDTKFFTEQALIEEKIRLDGIAAAEAEFQRTRLENGLINEQTYQSEITRIQDEARIAKEEAQAERDAVEAERKLIDLENQAIIDEEKFKNDFDLATERERIRYEAEMKAAEKTGADKTLIAKKHADAQFKINQAKDLAQVDSAAQTFGAIAGLLGEHTAAGKAAAIAQATMNAYTGVTQVWAADSILPEPIATIQKGISTGVVLLSALGAVRKIVNTKVKAARGMLLEKFARGSILSGPSHANGGIPFTLNGRPGFEAEGGEAIINKKSVSMFKPLLSKINEAGGGVRFASGGMPSISGMGAASSRDFIDYDLLAGKMAEANSMLPQPVIFTAIEDINYGQGKYAKVVEGASFGG